MVRPVSVSSFWTSIYHEAQAGPLMVSLSNHAAAAVGGDEQAPGARMIFRTSLALRHAPVLPQAGRLSRRFDQL